MHRIQNLRSFEECVSEVIEEYINNKGLYPSNGVLQINTLSMEVSIDLSSDEEHIDNISLTGILSSDGNLCEINYDAINNLASKYYFVR